MRYLLPIIALLLSTAPNRTLAQAVEEERPPARNALYTELGGAGGYYSLNYERVLRHLAPHQITLALRGGVSVGNSTDFIGHFNPDFVLPFALNGYWGERHHLEVGIGPTLSSYVSSHAQTFLPHRNYLIVLNAHVGYRYQPHTRGFLFRAGFTPYVVISRFTSSKTEIVPTSLWAWGGLSFGYAF